MFLSFQHENWEMEVYNGFDAGYGRVSLIFRLFTFQCFIPPFERNQTTIAGDRSFILFYQNQDTDCGEILEARFISVFTGMIGKIRVILTFLISFPADIYYMEIGKTVLIYRSKGKSSLVLTFLLSLSTVTDSMEMGNAGEEKYLARERYL